jgi:hypothetical protein
MEPEKDIFEQWAEERESKPWYKKITDSISLNWEFKYQYLWRDFKTGVKNIIYWLPIIWKDRNWDHDYIYAILQHKLKAQSKYIGDRGNHISAKRDAEVMMTCTRLIEKVQDDFYGMEYADYHEDKHWFTLTEKEGYFQLNSETLNENFDAYFKKYPLIYKRVMNGEGVFNREGREDDKKIIAMNIAHINHDRARKLLFKIMEQNIESWWD